MSNSHTLPKETASFFFGMKITHQQKKKIDDLASKLHISRSKAVAMLLDAIDIEKIPAITPEYTATQLAKMPANKRNRLIQMQVESSVRDFEIISDNQELVHF